MSDRVERVSQEPGTPVPVLSYILLLVRPPFNISRISVNEIDYGSDRCGIHVESFVCFPNSF